ncbi:hypothetical protein [Litorilituus sediminis]|uniref:Uncharacterized protein n=1 Tax=Litorilituus sediminis TaxID=718192 RepID=A0A4V0ZFM8_9GAMM|nr:hypothetical protein [Litorilituus sediminis]QBG34350.1 hypothetical protein EMK97_00630 [Litorilituus sediminis]
MTTANYTYLGTADDLVQRYPWQIEMNLENFNNMLIRKALLGERVLINDGYLLNLPAARLALLKPECSPLKALIEANFVRILSRNNDLVSMPSNMAKQGVTSFANLGNNSEWQALSAMLKKWQPKLQHIDNFIAWPKKHISHGFDTIMMRLYQKSPQQLGLLHTSHDELLRVFDNYQQQNMHDKEATRTRWENAVISELANSKHDKEKINELIGLACEGYHYNFGICLSNFSALEKANIIVETRYSQAFDDFMEINATQQECLAEMPVLDIPKNLPLDKPELWKQVVDPFSDIADLQTTYKQSMSLYSAGQTSKEALKQAAKEYSVALSKHFGQKEDMGLGAKSKRVLGLGFFGAGALVSLPVAALLWFSETELLPAVMKRFQIRDKKFFSENKSNLPLVNMQNKPMITSVALNKEKALTLSKHIPSF